MIPGGSDHDRSSNWDPLLRACRDPSLDFRRVVARESAFEGKIAVADLGRRITTFNPPRRGRGLSSARAIPAREKVPLSRKFRTLANSRDTWRAPICGRQAIGRERASERCMEKVHSPLSEPIMLCFVQGFHVRDDSKYRRSKR